MRNPFRASAGRRKAISAALAIAALSVGAAGCSVDPGDDAETASTAGQAPPASKPSTSYRLTDGGKALVNSSGDRIEIDPKSVTGYADGGALNGEYIDISGWAAPADLSSPANTVVAVVGKKSVAAVKPSGKRPDLVDGYDRPGLAEAGFALSVPRSSLNCSAPDQGLKLFGVTGKVAGPLKWLGDVPQIVADAC